MDPSVKNILRLIALIWQYHYDRSYRRCELDKHMIIALFFTALCFLIFAVITVPI